MRYTCPEIAKMIDHSLLRPELTDNDLIKGFEIAIKYNVASVCCGPSQVALARKHLAGTDVKVTTVIGFPNGYNTTEVKVFEAEQAMREGAVELDMVINIGKLLSHDFEYVKNDIKAVVDLAHKNNVLVKIILENYYLTDDLKVAGCRLAEEAGADWVKTSTGFAAGGATTEDLRLMKNTVSDKVQVKAAGGVRDLDKAIEVKEIGCTRFGATKTTEIMEECYKRKEK
jgi:deoxyribose-phosphate aldolase